MASESAGPRSTKVLPLFPLGTVLFPGSSLPLHIFEQRYREMVARCLETAEREFAIHLIREGDEVVERPSSEHPPGRPAVPHEVGTVARIVDLEHLPDGRYLLVCTGQRRVRLCRIVRETPYLTGEVEDLPDDDEPGVALDELTAQVRGATERLLAAIEDAIPPKDAEQRARVRQVGRTVPAGAAALSFFVPRTLAGASVEEKQDLLQTRQVRRRLQLELPLLFRERQLIQQLKGLGRARPGRGDGDDGSPGQSGTFGPIGRPSLN